MLVSLDAKAMKVHEHQPAACQAQAHNCPPSLQALRAEVAARPGLLGCSVFGLDDTAAVLHPFLRAFRAGQSSDPTLQPYLLCADVTRAFDSGEAAAASTAAAARMSTALRTRFPPPRLFQTNTSQPCTTMHPPTSPLFACSACGPAAEPCRATPAWELLPYAALHCCVTQPWRCARALRPCSAAIATP